MKSDSAIRNNIDTDADIKGIGLQKARAAERLLQALLQEKKCVFCTIEYVDDVFQIDLETTVSKIQTEQNKNYEKSFSMNTEEIKKTLRIFFDTWRRVEESEEISFVFYTNTSIAKENNIGIIKKIKMQLPSEPLLKLLIEKKYDESLPLVVPIFKEYYIDQHKKHNKDTTYHEALIDGMSQKKWEQFFNLIEWRFEDNDELQIRKRLIELVKDLSLSFGVELKHSNSILNSILGLIESQAMEKDFLNKVVHVSQIELLFTNMVREAKVEERLDPAYKKWDDIKINDIRNMEEKILNVCPTYSGDLLAELEDDFIDGKFEQDNYPEIKEVKAFNYRVYKASKKYITNLIKQKNTFSEDEIEKIINELTATAENHILDKSKTYKMPYKDQDMIYKSILILFQECFLALDKVGEKIEQ